MRKSLTRRMIYGLGFLLMMGVNYVAGAQGQTGTDRPTTTAIEPAADQLLRQMSDKLKGAQQFTVTGRRTMDQALAQDRPVDLEIMFDLSVRRPSQLIARTEGNKSKRTFVYDGAHATLYDGTINAYATVDTSGNIDAMLDSLQNKYGYTPPLADFLVQDPYADLTRNLQSGRVEGRENLGGEECQHLAFTREDADWELWLSTADQLPRKFVLIEKTMPGHPRLEATFTKWDLAPQLEAGAFTFKPPQGAEKIDMIPLSSLDNASSGQAPISK